jgi:hypothetical protein
MNRRTVNEGILTIVAAAMLRDVDSSRGVVDAMVREQGECI